MATTDALVDADCEQFLLVRDRASGATAMVAVHDTRRGPAHGGIRRWQYGSLQAAAEDVVALAQAMTWKCALAGVPAGGGKAVVLDHPGLDRQAAYRLVGRTVEQLGGRFFTGPDVGTTADDLATVAAATRFVATDRGDGPGNLAAATATGVASAIESLAERLGKPMAGLLVAVQGLGAVGMELCRELAGRGVRLVVSDLAVARTAAAAQAFAATVVAPDRLLATPCDVLAPCALGGVLTAAVARELPVLGVCGAANNIFADDRAPRLLHERGVQVVPDFVANAGALIAGALWHLRGERIGSARLRQIGVTAGELLDRARAENVPPSVLAMAVARERVERGG